MPNQLASRLYPASSPLKIAQWPNGFLIKVVLLNLSQIPKVVLFSALNGVALFSPLIPTFELLSPLSSCTYQSIGCPRRALTKMRFSYRYYSILQFSSAPDVINHCTQPTCFQLSDDFFLNKDVLFDYPEAQAVLLSLSNTQAMLSSQLPQNVFFPRMCFFCLL